MSKMTPEQELDYLRNERRSLNVKIKRLMKVVNERSGISEEDAEKLREHNVDCGVESWDSDNTHEECSNRFEDYTYLELLKEAEDIEYESVETQRMRADYETHQILVRR